MVGKDLEPYITAGIDAKNWGVKAAVVPFKHITVIDSKSVATLTCRDMFKFFLSTAATLRGQFHTEYLIFPNFVFLQNQLQTHNATTSHQVFVGKWTLLINSNFSNTDTVDAS